MNKKKGDLGVLIDGEFKVTDQTPEKISKANRSVGLIRTFVLVGETIFRTLFVTHANQVVPINRIILRQMKR